MLEFHRVRGTALREGAKLRSVAEHFSQRHFSLDALAAANEVVHALDHTTAGRKVAHDVAHLFFRRFDFDSHDRLEKNRISLAHTFLEGHGGSHLERVFVRVDFVVGTEVERDLHVNNRVAGEDASLERVFDTLFNGRDVFARNHAALDGVDEFEALAGFERFELEHDVTVLTTAAGLLGELAFGVFNHGADRFTVSNLGLAHGGFDVEFALHAVDENFEVEFAHTGNNRLAGFFVGLKSADGTCVPVLFRPFHEHTGNGFWWGKGNCTAEEYIALWRFTLEYLRDTKGVHNLLYVYSPDIVSSQDNYLEFWPGDAYVDVLGLDAYDRSSWAIETNGLRLMRLLKHIAYLKNKPFAFTETGLENNTSQSKWWTEKLSKAIAGVPVAYVLVWRNKDTNHFFGPYPGCVSEEDFKTFVAGEQILLEKDIAGIYE